MAKVNGRICRVKSTLRGIVFLAVIGVALYQLTMSRNVIAPALVPPPATQPAIRSCVIPFSINKNGLLIVDATVSINPGKRLPLHMALDTGAPKSCFFASAEMVTNLSKIIPGAKLDEWVKSDGSGVSVCRISPAQIDLPNISLSMPVYASTYDMSIVPGYDGLIGQDVLSRYEVDIDYDLSEMILTPRSSH